MAIRPQNALAAKATNVTASAHRAGAGGVYPAAPVTSAEAAKSRLAASSRFVTADIDGHASRFSGGP
ncbi:hypothetical protein [Actinophytocola sp.]|uniref:hypothetical protein n=1 Tax=Actinophytocola sp. TaxID=1872138 RepID=UPI0038999888